MCVAVYDKKKITSRNRIGLKQMIICAIRNLLTETHVSFQKMTTEANYSVDKLCTDNLGSKFPRKCAFSGK